MVFENNVVEGPPALHPVPRICIGRTLMNEIDDKDPKKVIVVDAKTGQEITYGELRKLIIRSVRAFERLGVTKDDIVTMFPRNTIEFLIAYLGGLCLGCTLNLLNPDYTIGEVRHFFAMCRPKAVLTSASNVATVLKLKEEFPGFEIVFVGSGAEEWKGLQRFKSLVDSVPNDEVESFVVPDINPSEEIMILTSSGTTGFPKGVLLTHDFLRAISFFVRGPDGLDYKETETTLGYLPFFHIFGAFCNLASIFTGGKLVLLEKFSPTIFLKAIQDHKVSKLFAVPPILLFLTQSPLVDSYDCSSISDVISGAAPLPRNVEENIKKRFKVDAVRQIYGSTEANAATCTPRGAQKPGSVGTPNTSFKMKVCDVNTWRTLGPKEVGEVCIKSPGVMKGYCCNEAETKASFDEEGYCKTGDLGYYDEDGFFYIVERLKEVIKCKGFQVSPAELEAILLKCPGVKDVGVVGFPDERSGEVPLAFVVKAPRSNVTEEDLVKYVADNVSIQKQLKGGVRFIQEIPRTASGKILRRELKTLTKAA